MGGSTVVRPANYASDEQSSLAGLEMASLNHGNTLKSLKSSEGTGSEADVKLPVSPHRAVVMPPIPELEDDY